MPLTAAGELSIVSSADLGPLGAATGAAVAYHWDWPNVAPQLVPWLLVLGLLVLRPNRNGSAWLIWLPIICSIGVTRLPLGLPSGGDFLLDAAVALAFALAAVWLLSPYLRRRHRLLTVLCVLSVLGVFGALELVANQCGGLSVDEWIPAAMVLGFGVLASDLALGVVGWLCRRGFSPVRLYVCLLASLLVVWLVMAAPFILAALLTANEVFAWSEFLIPIIGAAGVNFALLLPFLILSSANPVFHERLKSLLHVQPPVAPPLAAPATPETALKT